MPSAGPAVNATSARARQGAPARVWYHRYRLAQQPRRHRPDDGRDHPSRPGCLWLFSGRARRARQPAPQHHRPRERQSADLERGRRRASGLQWRDLQQPGPAAAADRGGASLQDRDRRRGHPASLRGARQRLRQAPARHVRLRALGPDEEDLAARPRSSGTEAAVLLSGRRAVPLRLRDQGDPGIGPGAAADRPRGPVALRLDALPARPVHALQGHPEAAGRHAAVLPGRHVSPGALLGRRLHPQVGRRRGGDHRRAGPPPQGDDPDAPAERRARRRVPQRRHRFRAWYRR